jgi:transcriptional regulator with XRE-family HTH domain
VPFRPDRLKALREAKGLSQEQLAKRAGLSHPVITKSENGKNLPRAEALDKLAQALDCTMDYLHGRGYEQESPAVAAAHMAFEVFVTQQDLSDEQRERYRRVLRHADAPKTAHAWRSFAEMIELAIGPTLSTTSLALIGEQRPKSKPMAVARRRNT